MYDLSDFKRGLKVLLDGQPYSVIEFQHVKPGKGNQFTRTKLKNTSFYYGSEPRTYF